MGKLNFIANHDGFKGYVLEAKLSGLKSASRNLPGIVVHFDRKLDWQALVSLGAGLSEMRLT